MKMISPNWLAWKLGVPIEVIEEVAAGIEQTPDLYYRHRVILTNSGKARPIDEPIGALRLIQERIKQRVLAPFPFPSSFHGSVRGRSSKTNAEVHLASSCLVRMDMRDYYPHATCRLVHDAWRVRFPFGAPVVKLLTRFTTVRGHLPQGALTSGYVGNLILLSISERIEAVAKQLGCRVTFYVDDIGFSGANARQMIEPTVGILRSIGLSAGHRKTEIMSARGAQVITGYVVNGAIVSVPLVKREAVRNDIFRMRVAERRGEDSSKTARSIRGRIAYINMTNEGNAVRLLRLLENV